MTVGIELIVGLANPGSQYELTRHNAGAWFVGLLCQCSSISLKLDKKLFCQIGKISLNEKTCFVAVPTTYMNDSGQALRAISQYYKISPEKILIAHDEIDLPIGTARLKIGGGHGGHNGLRDIQQALGSNKFCRLRIGVGHPGQKEKVVGYVLNRPSTDEQIEIDLSIKKAAEQVGLLLNGQWQQAQTNLHST